MIEIKAPHNYQTLSGFKVFLSGSIEMGTAIDWQNRIINLWSDLNIIILNPRRDDWDNTWVQSISIHDARFFEQVQWELQAMEDSDLIICYFEPSTKAPITLLELGLNIRSNVPLYVCVPDGFYRQGNVEIVCKRYGVFYTNQIDILVSELRMKILRDAPFQFNNAIKNADIRWKPVMKLS